jgi:heme/copper-type cytochrome/quinol oxidase subunit 2
MFHWLSRSFVEWFENHGIDPYLGVTIIVLCCFFLAVRDFRRHKTEEPHWRRLTVAQVSVLGLTSLLCILVLIVPGPRKASDIARPKAVNEREGFEPLSTDAGRWLDWARDSSAEQKKRAGRDSAAIPEGRRDTCP